MTGECALSWMFAKKHNVVVYIHVHVATISTYLHVCTCSQS